MSRLYGHSLSESDYNSELAYLEKVIDKDDEDPFGDNPMKQMMQNAKNVEFEVENDEEEEQEPFN